MARDLAISAVKAGFILKGTSMRAWCQAQGVDTGYASKALAGKQSGPKAQALKDRIIQASRAVD